MNDATPPPEGPDLQPKSTGSSGEQEPVPPSHSLARIEPSGPEVGHIGALLTEQSDSERLFNRRVALAALHDAEASRQFVQRKLDEANESLSSTRDSLHDATKEVAILETKLAAYVSTRWPQQLTFGIGAGVFGAGSGLALSNQEGPLTWIAILLGIVLMIVGAFNTMSQD